VSYTISHPDDSQKLSEALSEKLSGKESRKLTD
jgi:hypothetical protein